MCEQEIRILSYQDGPGIYSQIRYQSWRFLQKRRGSNSLRTAQTLQSMDGYG